LPSQLSGVSDGRANGQHPSARRAERGKFSSSHDFSMGRSASRTTSSSVGSCFFTVSVNVLNAEPIAAVALGDSNPASGFAPVFSPKARGSGVNVVSPASASAANGAPDVGEQGIHGYKTMDDLMWSVRGDPERLVVRSQITECDGVVIGTVALWGVIWDHARGYRAQFARPISFISSYGKRSQEALAELRTSFLK